MTNQPGDPNDPYQPRPPHEQPSYGQQPAPQYGQQHGQQQYGQQPGYGGYAPDHPKATTALVLGILGIVVCGVLAPFAWRIGKRTVEEIDGSNGRLGGRGTAQAGYVLGLIGTVLVVLYLLAGIGLVLLFVITAASSGGTS